MDFVNNLAFLSLMLRIILGLLFFFQGYDKIFNIKINGVIDSFKFEFGIKAPKWILIFMAFFTSYIEFIGGALLIIGLFKIPVLYILGVDLMIVTLAFSMVKPMWDMQFVFPRLLILVALLLLPVDSDYFSVDFILKRVFQNS